jgi:hypothetical protein
MPTIRTLAFCALALTAPNLFAQAAAEQKGPDLSGTWFGEFNQANPDGKVSHDTAVLIMEQHGPSVTGSIGPTADQQMPLTDGRMDDGNIRFHLDALGGTASSLVVNAVPGFGAIEAGTHRFYSRQRDGSEHLDATAQFTNVWSKETGSWKVVRVISYDHR